METRDSKEFKRPFLAIPEPCAYFPAETTEEIRESVFRRLNRGEGVSVVFGETGLGKTLLLRVLAEQFQTTDTVLFVSHSRIRNAKSLLQHILFSLNLNFAGCNENELRLLLLDYLNRTIQQRLILLIDEAQFLPFSAFEEIRSLLDLSNGETSKIRVAFAGTPKFEERFAQPRFASLQQRIVSRSYLEPFVQSETVGYIDAELKRAGDVFANVQFSVEAKKAVHRLTEGIPRVVNQLCDHSLFLVLQRRSESVLPVATNLEFGTNETNADFLWNEVSKFEHFYHCFLENLSPSDSIVVDEEDVYSAWSSLQQLPKETTNVRFKTGTSDFAVFNSDVSNGAFDSGSLDGESSSARQSNDSVVEFGSLDSDSQPSEPTTESVFQPPKESSSPKTNSDDLIKNFPAPLDSNEKNQASFVVSLSPDHITVERPNDESPNDAAIERSEEDEDDLDKNFEELEDYILKNEITWKKPQSLDSFPLTTIVPNAPLDEPKTPDQTNVSSSKPKSRRSKLDDPSDDRSPENNSFLSIDRLFYPPNEDDSDIARNRLSNDDFKSDSSDAFPLLDHSFDEKAESVPSLFEQRLFDESNADLSYQEMIDAHILDSSSDATIFQPGKTRTTNVSFDSSENSESATVGFRRDGKRRYSVSELYLKELDQLEAEITQEADLIRKIRDVHLNLQEAKKSLENDRCDRVRFDEPNEENENETIPMKKKNENSPFSLKDVFRKIYQKD